MTLMLTALEAAELTGLGSAGRFRRAVERGEMPGPHCPKARPQLWSRAAIEAKGNGGNACAFQMHVFTKLHGMPLRPIGK